MAVFILLIFYFNILLCCDAESTVSTKAGVFKGLIRDLDVYGKAKQVGKYLGIPYAEAPVGDRRFRKPVLKAPMTSVYDATKYGASCMQLEINLGHTGGKRNPDAILEKFSEDCLFLNIHTPIPETDYPKPSELLPVMVWIHGGGFICGSSSTFNADWLSVYGNVIVVTLNYRLAVWGFLTSGDSTVPGNLGLWDQHIALKWVNQNINAFGGDPKKVTIFGQSAGGSSVVFQSSFPRNAGLFQRAIAMAGSISCPWSYQPRPADAALRLGQILDCDTNSELANVISCIKSKSTKELHHALNDKANKFIRFPMEFVPSIDGEFLKENPLNALTSNTAHSLESQQFFSTVDFMTGITANEGGMMIHSFVGIEDAENYPSSRQEFENKIVPDVAKLMFGNNAHEALSDVIVNEYTNWDNPDNLQNVRDAFIDMSSDYVFDIHAKIVADSHAYISSGKSTYVYVLDENPSQSWAGKPSWLRQVIHADEQVFLYGYDREGIIRWTEPYSEDYEPQKWELDVSNLFITLLTNFAKSGYVTAFILVYFIRMGTLSGKAILQFSFCLPSQWESTLNRLCLPTPGQ